MPTTIQPVTKRSVLWTPPKTAATVGWKAAFQSTAPWTSPVHKIHGGRKASWSCRQGLMGPNSMEPPGLSWSSMRKWTSLETKSSLRPPQSPSNPRHKHPPRVMWFPIPSMRCLPHLCFGGTWRAQVKTSTPMGVFRSQEWSLSPLATPSRRNRRFWRIRGDCIRQKRKATINISPVLSTLHTGIYLHPKDFSGPSSWCLHTDRTSAACLDTGEQPSPGQPNRLGAAPQPRVLALLEAQGKNPSMGTLGYFSLECLVGVVGDVGLGFSELLQKEGYVGSIKEPINLVTGKQTPLWHLLFLRRASYTYILYIYTSSCWWVGWIGFLLVIKKRKGKKKSWFVVTLGLGGVIYQFVFQFLESVWWYWNL